MCQGGLPAFIGDEPGAEEEQKWKVQDVQTVGKASEAMRNLRVRRRIPADSKLQHGEQEESEDEADLKIAEKGILLENTRNGEGYARENRRKTEQTEGGESGTDLHPGIENYQPASRKPNQETNQNAAADKSACEYGEASQGNGDAETAPQPGQAGGERNRKQRVIPEFVRQAPERGVRTESVAKNRLKKKQVAQKVAGSEVVQRHGGPKISEWLRVNSFRGKQPDAQAVPEKSEEQARNEDDV